MSELIGPDRSAVLWYGAGRRAAAVPPEAKRTAPGAAPAEAREITVDVWLFGFLSTLTTDRSVVLTLPADATTMDVVAALEARFGADSLKSIKDPESGLLPCCRIFVDGVAQEDLTAPVSTGGKPAKLEMILLKGFVGG